jgi:hypothetical protein
MLEPGPKGVNLRRWWVESSNGLQISCKAIIHAPALINCFRCLATGRPAPARSRGPPRPVGCILRVRRRGLDGGRGNLVVSSHLCSGRCAQYYWDWFACAVICFFRVISSQKPHCSTILPFSSR